MLTHKRILFASLLAPLAIILPLLALSAIGWSLFDPLTDGDAPIRMAGIGIMLSFPIYLFLVVVTYLASQSLRFFNHLSHRSLLIVAATLSIVIAAINSVWWLFLGSSALKATESFTTVLLISIIASMPVCYAWWRLAANPSFKQDALTRAS